MIKRCAAFLLTLILFLALSPLCAHADELYDAGSRVLDHDDILTQDEEQRLEEKIAQVSAAHNGFDIIILTVDDMGGKDAKLFTADYFMDNGFGTGENRDGLIMMIYDGNDEDVREFCSAGHGYGEIAVGAYFYDCLFDASDVVSKLSDNYFYQALDEYLDVADRFLTQYETGEPYGYDVNEYSYMGLGEFIIIFLVVAAVSLAIGLGYAGALKRRMITALKPSYASDYIRKNSFKLTKSSDIYMYSTHTKTPRPTESESRGSSHGGGSFSSSGGSSFSGGSSRF